MTPFVATLTALLLLLTRVTGIRRMMFAIMLVRPSCDRLFDWLKLTLDGRSGPGASINAVVIVMAIVAILHVPEIAVSAPLLGWSAFIAAAAVSLLGVPDPDNGLRALLSLISYAAVFVLPYALIRTRRTLAQCLGVALASSMVPASYALAEIAAWPDTRSGDQRLQSTFTHPNIFAFYIVGVVSLILYMTCSRWISLSTTRRRALFGYAGYLLLLLLLTKTRSAWGAMAVILAGYALVVDRRWLIPALGLPLVLLVPGVSGRLADLETGTIAAGFEQLNSLAWRELLWKDTIEWLRSNPPGLFGYGLDSYQSYVPQFFPRVGDATVGPHNAFLQIYFEIGVFGLIAFALLMSAIIWKLMSSVRKDFAGSVTMLMLCGGYVLVFYYDNLLDYLQFQWFFWFVLGAVCASAKFAQHAVTAQPAVSRSTIDPQAPRVPSIVHFGPMPPA